MLLERSTRQPRPFRELQSASQGIAIVRPALWDSRFVDADKAQMTAWGWRIPFALGLLIVPVGLYIRRRLPETLESPGSRGSGAVLGLLGTKHRLPLVLAVFIIMSLTISTYVNNYMTTYALTTLGMAPAKAILATIANGAVMAAAALCSGGLSDRFGRKPVMILPRIALVAAVYPAFLLLTTVSTTGVLVFVTILLTLLANLSATAAMTALTEVFPNEVRSSGLAVSYAIAVSVFGGTTQFVVAWLIGTTGDRLSPAYYVIVTGVISLWAMFKLPETYRSARPRPADPHRSAQRYQLVIKVITRVVQHAGARAVTALAMLAFAIADQQIAPGLLEQVEAEILGSHGGLELLHVVRPHPAG